MQPFRIAQEHELTYVAHVQEYSIFELCFKKRGNRDDEILAQMMEICKLMKKFLTLQKQMC